jgi:hypothetical protein
MSTTFINRGHFYAPHVKPVLIDCNFVVDTSNGNGLGIRNLKGQGVQNVFMHTTASPGKGPNGQLNPNPAVGFALIQLADNYQRYFGGFDGFVSPLSGSSLNVDAIDAALTARKAYVITSVGTSTAADWLALGVPAGVTPAVGVSFIALVTGAGVGSGTVQAPAASNIISIEVVGDPNLSLGPIPVGGSPNVGGWILVQFLAPTITSSTIMNNPLIPTAPAAGSGVGLSFYLSQSSVTVLGE